MSMHYLQTHCAVISLLVSSGMSWTVMAAEAIPTSVNSDAISSIQFKLADKNLEQFGYKITSKQIVDRVINNLAEWQFPVKPGDTHYSHTLEATLDEIGDDTTPTGFSYSSGNSDPRSPQFQKANVLPISCRLKKSDSKDTNVEHKMTFSAPLLATQPNQSKALDKLVDQISTACFTLLDELKLPAVNNKVNTVSFKPTWMPELRVEVKQAPEPVAPTAIKSSGAETNDNSRKEIIIYNQGSPLTITLGHERR